MKFTKIDIDMDSYPLTINLRLMLRYRKVEGAHQLQLLSHFNRCFFTECFFWISFVLFLDFYWRQGASLSLAPSRAHTHTRILSLPVSLSLSPLTTHICRTISTSIFIWKHPATHDPDPRRMTQPLCVIDVWELA